MKKSRFFINILIVLIACTSKLYAEELIVPAVKSPYDISNIKWDSNNNDFSYEVNNKVYIRDSFTLLLKDVHESTGVAYESEKPALPAGIKAYAGVSDVCKTKDGNYIVADSSKTAGLYNSQGQKLKTYTSSSIIAGLSLTPDNETLIITDLNNTLHFYNAKSASYIGYSPKFGTKKIRSVQVNGDSTKLLVTTSDNNIFITRIQDVIFAPETVAPSIKQFSVVYNAEDPNNQSKNVVTEFSVREVRAKDEVDSTEYITSTKEKATEKQNFDIDEIEKNKKTEVVIVQQPEQEYFPPSATEDDKEVLFTNKDTILESHVTEYRIPERVKQPEVTTVPVQKEKIQTPIDDTPKQYTVPEEPKVIVRRTETATTTPAASETPVTTVTKPAAAAKTEVVQQPQYIIIQTTEEIEEEPVEVKTAEVPVVVETKTTKKKVTKKETKEEEEDEEKKTEKRKLSDEDLKTYFKDGHGLLFNIGAGSMKAPYTVSTSFETAYYNYDLIYPFHLGGFTSFSLGMPKNDFPYKYANSKGVIHNPYLMDVFIAAPIGFSIYPFKNSLEIYLDIIPGVALYKLWNGVIGDNSIAGKFFPVYRTSARIGAAWDFINLSFNVQYDTMQTTTFGIQLGALINIGGSRTIGSLKMVTTNEN